MAILTTKASARLFTLGFKDDGNIIEFGPAGTNNQVGTMVLQFKSSIGAQFSVVVMGRVFGVAADSADMPFVPIPYRIISLNNVAQDYAIVADTIVTDALIQVPANGISVAVLAGWTSGTVAVAAWDMNGPGAI
jgi:hypothetical protein